MDHEYRLPAEYQPPGEEYPAPKEAYGTKAEEFPKPESGDGIPRRTKKAGRRLMAALLAVAGVTTVVLAQSAAIQAPETHTAAEIPSKSEVSAMESESTHLQEETLPQEQTQTESDVVLSDAELLLRVGTWVSQDGLMTVHFDADGGWWKRQDGNTYGLMSWHEENGLVAYSGFGADIEALEIKESDGYIYRTMVDRTVAGEVTVLAYGEQPSIRLDDPFGGEGKVYVPGVQTEASAPRAHYHYDLREELPGSGWGVAPFSTMEADKAAAQNDEVSFFRLYIWISGAEFTEDTCTLTFSDSTGGSASFAFTWAYAPETDAPKILLYPAEEIRYVLQDENGAGTTEFSMLAEKFTAVMSISDDGPVLYLPNSFFNQRYGLAHEVMLRNR